MNVHNERQTGIVAKFTIWVDNGVTPVHAPIPEGKNVTEVWRFLRFAKESVAEIAMSLNGLLDVSCSNSFHLCWEA